ncbi:hypothetical protein A2U01_0025674, partial [Trifolium medium]|nr:hypothetical protein [Trifolium medium]
MASSSTPVVQNPNNPLNLSPIATVGNTLIYTGDVMQFNIGLLKLRPEKMVDFESLKVNGFDVEELSTNQGWKRYFEMLNGPIYTNMVKEFWMKARVYDNVASRTEEEQLIKKDPSLKGKSREEMGLSTFTGTVIKYVLAGLDITISRAHFAKLLDLKDQGKRISDYKSEIYYRQSIKKELGGGTDTISWEHQHLLYFLKSGKKINLVDLLFENLCQAIRESNFRNITTLVYPKLLSELFFQTKLVKILMKAYPELVEEERAQKLDASFLTRM